MSTTEETTDATPEAIVHGTVSLLAEQSENLDTICFRGSAPLELLARLTQADVFDQEANPNGLQRDLSKKHAQEAYDFVARDRDKKLPRAFPEVVLNVRDTKVVQIEEVDTGVDGFKLVRATFDLDAILNAKTVKVSRVDGNHRLFYGAGDGDNREPIKLAAPFQLHVGLTKPQEANLFADINANAKAMNTSHLAVLRARNTSEKIDIVRQPWRVFAMRLVNDTASPFMGMVHMGGSKEGSKKKGIKHTLNYVALENATKRLIARSAHLGEMADTDAQYALIRAYWQAVATTWPEAFENPSDFLLTKGIGVNVLAQVGGVVIDRAMIVGDVDAAAMGAMLASTHDVWDWHKDAPSGPSDKGVAGLSGNPGILKLAGGMIDALPKPKAGK